MFKDQIKVVDNFFPTLFERELHQVLFGPDSYGEWKYMNTISYNNKKNDSGRIKSWSNHNPCQDTEGFVLAINLQEPRNKKLINNFKHFIKEKFDTKVEKILRLNIVYLPANVNYKEGYHLYPHIDMTKLPHKNILYYMFDNDAETIFFNQQYKGDGIVDYGKQEIIHKVKPKQNRAIMFDGWIFHAEAVSKIDKRVTVNINFI